jgi:hypothetical protein
MIDVPEPLALVEAIVNGVSVDLGTGAYLCAVIATLDPVPLSHVPNALPPTKQKPQAPVGADEPIPRENTAGAAVVPLVVAANAPNELDVPVICRVVVYPDVSFVFTEMVSEIHDILPALTFGVIVGIINEPPEVSEIVIIGFIETLIKALVELDIILYVIMTCPSAPFPPFAYLGLLKLAPPPPPPGEKPLYPA